MILIDPKLLEQLGDSTCFGIAHSEEAKECKRCDLQQECMSKTQGNSVFDQYKKLKPETKEALSDKRKTKFDVIKGGGKNKEDEEEIKGETSKSDILDTEPEVKPKKKKRKKKPRPVGMPITKDMEIDELWKLVKARDGKCKEYEDDKIQKMQLVMALRRTYE